MNRRFVLIAALIIASVQCSSCDAPDVAESNKPIIANLYANAAKYDGRKVIIYGLVIEVENGGRQFILQDVSQMPLKIRKTEGLPAVVGDQILLQGIFKANHGDPYLDAAQMTYTKVLGGGGCC